MFLGLIRGLLLLLLLLLLLCCARGGPGTGGRHERQQPKSSKGWAVEQGVGFRQGIVKFSIIPSLSCQYRRVRFHAFRSFKGEGERGERGKGAGQEKNKIK